jgi:hypothetical protein
VPATRGQQISVVVTDSLSRSSAVPVGTVPFAVVETNERTAFDDEPSFSGARVASDGTHSLVIGNASRALLFRQGDASEPAAVSNFDTSLFFPNDVEIRSNYAWLTGFRLVSVGYLDPVPTLSYSDTDPGPVQTAIALSGNHAFTADQSSSTIYVYDISSPTSPLYLRSQIVGSSEFLQYRDLIAYGPQYILAVTQGGDPDVVVVDVSNPADLVTVAELSIDNFIAVSGAVEGTTLYLAGGDTGVAVVDLSTTPQVRAIVDTPGIARSIAVTRANEIVVADGGGPGLTFLDTSNRQQPIVLGSQPLTGNAIDVHVVGNRIYVVTQNRFKVLKLP